MENVIQDVRYGLRMLRKSPGFTAVAVITLALGIGANTAMFSVMNAVLLRYLPVRDPQRLVFLHYNDQPEGTSQTGYDDASLPEPAFEALRARHDIFSDLMAFVPLATNQVPVRYGDIPEEARGDMVSGNFFSGLGVNALRGRTFTLKDETAHAPLVVLSYSYWSRRFGKDPEVLGRPFYIKGVPFTIVGIARPGFLGLERQKATDFWIPLQNRADLKPWGHPAQDNTVSLYGAPHWFFLMLAGRLAPDISREQALQRVQPIYQRVAYAGLKAPAPGSKPSELYFTDSRGIEGLRDDYKQPLMVLMYMVLLVLGIACANVSLLLVARNTLRQREFSLRLALGSSAWRLFTQLLSESALLVIAGAALGWWFAQLATSALARWSDLDISLAPDRTVLLFTIAMSAAVGLVFGVAPLRSATRAPLGAALKGAVTSTYDRGKIRAGQVVVALQIAVCIVLLVGAALLVRTMGKLQGAYLGMRSSGLVVFDITPPRAVSNDAQALAFYQSLLETMRSLPGVESATLIQERPGSGWSNNTGVRVDGANPLGTKFAPVRWSTIGPDFLRVLGTPLLLGRDISPRDTAASAKVALINRTFVQRYLKGGAPLGHQIQLQGENGTFTVIGVIPDLKFTGVREKQRPMAFVPYTQMSGISSMTVELRSASDFGSVLAEARRALRDLNPDVAPLRPMTQQAQFEESYSDERLFSRLGMFFGALAALLVTTGLFGALAYRVNRRITEIGLRMALGAQRRQVLWLVLRESLALSLAGLAIGLPVAGLAARLLRSILFGLSPGDALSFLAALLGIALITLIASAIPARRASSVDPMVALRYE